MTLGELLSWQPSDPYAESDPNVPEPGESLWEQITSAPGDLMDAIEQRQKEALEAAKRAAEEAARLALRAQKAWWSWVWDAALAPFRLVKRVLYGMQDYMLRGAQMLGDGIESLFGVRLGTGLLIAAPFGLAFAAMWIWGVLPAVPGLINAAARVPIRAIEVLGAPLISLAKMMV